MGFHSRISLIDLLSLEISPETLGLASYPNKMPVVGSFDPEDLAGLQSKIDETESVGEICELVKTHVSS